LALGARALELPAATLEDVFDGGNVDAHLALAREARLTREAKADDGGDVSEVVLFNALQLREAGCALEHRDAAQAARGDAAARRADWNAGRLQRLEEIFLRAQQNGLGPP
jgi:hypothetical protein